MDEATRSLIDGLMDIEAVGATITFDGTNYPCVGGAEFADQLLGSGGLKITADVTVIVRTSVFASVDARPKEERSIIFKSIPEAAGLSLRIKNITTFREAFLVLACIYAQQGA